MKTTPEMILLNHAEINGHAETARILREIVDKQRLATPPEAPETAIPCDLAGCWEEYDRIPLWRECYDTKATNPFIQELEDACVNKPKCVKHRFIHLSGETRQEPACQ